MEKESLSDLMDINMSVILWMIKDMEKEKLCDRTVMYMSDSIRMISLMVME